MLRDRFHPLIESTGWGLIQGCPEVIEARSVRCTALREPPFGSSDSDTPTVEPTALSAQCGGELKVSIAPAGVKSRIFDFNHLRALERTGAAAIFARGEPSVPV